LKLSEAKYAETLFVYFKLFGELGVGRFGQMRVIVEHNHGDRFLSIVTPQNL